MCASAMNTWKSAVCEHAGILNISSAGLCYAIYVMLQERYENVTNMQYRIAQILISEILSNWH